MGSIMDQERPWERDPEGWEKPAPKPEKPKCDHDWKSQFEFIYDYDHQKCTKCGAKRMV